MYCGLGTRRVQKAPDRQSTRLTLLRRNDRNQQDNLCAGLRIQILIQGLGARIIGRADVRQYGQVDGLANSGHVRIHKCSRSGSYQVRIRKRYVSLLPTLNAAVEIREEAERRHRAGTLDAYIQELRRERSLKK